jgi:hypothetical protein
MVDPTEQDQWLGKHIPRRLRACIACLLLQEERLESPLFGLEASMFDRQTPLLAWRDLLKQS